MKDARRLRQYIACLVVLALTAYSAVIWSRLHGLWTCSGGAVGIADYVLYYMLGALAGGPLHLHIYDPAVQLAWQNALISPCKLATVFYCQYPPMVVPVVALLATMPILTSYFVWETLQMLALAAAIYWFLRSTTSLGKAQTAAFVLAGIGSMPPVDSYHVGQPSMMLAASGLIYAWSLLRGSAAGGAGLALILLKIQLLFPIAIPALGEMRVKLLAVAGSIIVALLLIGGYMIGWDNVIHYPTVVMQADQMSGAGISPERMVCLRGILSQFLEHRLAMKISLVVYAVSLLSAAAAWLMHRCRDQHELRWRIALSFVLGLIISPHMHLHDCTILVVPAVLTLPEMLAAQTLPRFQRLWMRQLIFFPFVSWLCFVPPLDVYPSVYSTLFAFWLLALLITGWRASKESTQ